MVEVPVIDIGPLAGGAGDPAAVASEIDDACREFGFFTVVGHAIDPRLRDRLDAASRSFFALDDTEKEGIAMARAGRAWRGWFPVGGELTSGVPDLKEGIYFGEELAPVDPRVLAGRPLHGQNLFPPSPPDLRPAVLSWMAEMQRLGQTILTGMAMGLGLEPAWFTDHLTADPVVLFRIFHYPPAAAFGPDASWGVGEHTDYGLLTILSQDDRGGLQVRAPTGWIDVAPLADSFVCNLGDMLERLTGGLYRSTPHRVRNNAATGRLSYPFFLDPSWDAVVEALPIVERPPGGDAADRWDHASVHGFAGTYGEYLLGKVARVFPDLATGLEDHKG